MERPSIRVITAQLSDQLARGTDKRFRETTGAKGIKDTKLAGRELLGKKTLDTEELITKYVAKVLKDRGANVWAKREVERGMLLELVQQHLGRP